MLFCAATHVLAKQVMATPPYDPQTDFVSVARVGEAPLMLVIAPALERSTLAITAEKRSPPAPDVPTMQEGALKAFKYTSWYGVWVSKGTPADRVAKLSATVTRASQRLDVAVPMG